MKRVIDICVKFLKKNLLGMIIGGTIVGCISIVNADYSFKGTHVYYNNSSSGGSSANVQGSIDELYSKIKYGNAGAGSILSGSTALVNGTKITGTMPNIGAVNQNINPGSSYTIPAGYHNGSGKVTAAPNQNSGTYTFGATDGSTVDLGVNNAYRYVNASNVYSNGRNSVGVSRPYIEQVTVTSQDNGVYYRIKNLTVGKTYYFVGSMHNASQRQRYTGWGVDKITLRGCTGLADVTDWYAEQSDAISQYGKAMTMFFSFRARATATGTSCVFYINQNDSENDWGGWLTAIGTNV